MIPGPPVGLLIPETAFPLPSEPQPLFKTRVPLYQGIQRCPATTLSADLPFQGATLATAHAYIILSPPLKDTDLLSFHSCFTRCPHAKGPRTYYRSAIPYPKSAAQGHGLTIFQPPLLRAVALGLSFSQWNVSRRNARHFRVVS